MTDLSFERIITEYPPKGWESLFTSNELKNISSKLNDEENKYGPYYPLKQDIFNAFYYTPLDQVKVVILGQDPYPQSVIIKNHKLPRAVGLSFSVRREDKVPSSLQNIYKELANTYPHFIKPKHGDLREWAQQGVLLLNYSLTVRAGVPASHIKIWNDFIQEVLTCLQKVHPQCIYILWGQHAQKFASKLGPSSIILKAAHPSGLSAHHGFFGCNHFVLANEELIRQGKTPINWQITPFFDTNVDPTLPYNYNAIPRMISSISSVAVPSPILVPWDELSIHQEIGQSFSKDLNNIEESKI